MYLSKVRLVNWRSYADATFTFTKPTKRRPLVLIGAMNGHGKTSFLVALYLGIFGRFGLRYCEGFDKFNDDDAPHYRKAIKLFRRNTADSDEPTIVEIIFTPTLFDSDEKEVRIVRRWYFTGSNEPKQGDSFEQVELYEEDKLARLLNPDSDRERLSKALFPEYIMPAFFFDGEQAQMLISNSGAPGIKKAVEVMFGTKVMEDVHEQIQRYLVTQNQRLGGRKQVSQKERDLAQKCRDSKEIDDDIAHLQTQHDDLLSEKERIEADRRQSHEQLAMLGGANAPDIQKLQHAVEDAEQDKSNAERSITSAVRELGLALAVSRLAIPIHNRLEAEEIRETWERLREGTIERADRVLEAAMPEPAETDDLLGHLAERVRLKVKERFRAALDHIYNPPPSGCASEFLLGHVKGEHRKSAQEALDRARRQTAADIRQRAKRLKEAREQYDEARSRFDRYSRLPEEAGKLARQIDDLNTQIAEADRRLAVLEHEIREKKAVVRRLTAEIGSLREELGRMGPDQKRIAVADRVHRVLDDLLDRLRPIALSHLQDTVTKHFLSIADKRFSKGRIIIPAQDGAPFFEWRSGAQQIIDTMSGFERRSFGIAFSLALAEITQKRVPLVIDTPLGNADSEYRPRLLDALTEVDLDQVVILTHDQEVTGSILQDVEGRVAQKFLVQFDAQDNMSVVKPNEYFGGSS